MDNVKNELLSNYLSNTKVNLSTASYNRCANEWGELDYMPSYSKFYFICDGEGWLKIGNQEFYPKPGQLFLLPEGVLQSYSVINNDPFLKYWCHFHIVTGDINLFNVIKVPFFKDVKDIDYVVGLFQKIILLYNSTELTAKLKLKSELYALISYFFDSTDENLISVRTSSKLTQLSSIVDYINNHLSEDITIQGISESAYLHPNSLARLFKEQMGISPSQYIHMKRIEKAKALLSSTDMLVSEVAYNAGFRDQFYFSKYFKTNVGFTPSEYRIVTQNQEKLQLI